jgi:LysM repeat protein
MAGLAAGPALASTYTVQSGDTLSGIAARSGVSLSGIETANPQVHDPNLSYLSQQVNVPDGRSGATPIPGPAAPAPVPATSDEESSATSQPAASEGSTTSTSSAGTLRRLLTSPPGPGRGEPGPNHTHLPGPRLGLIPRPGWLCSLTQLAFSLLRLCTVHVMGANRGT